MRIYPAFQIWVYFHLGSCAGQFFIYKNENGLFFLESDISLCK